MVNALHRQWKKVPPVNVLAAAFLKYQPPAEVRPKPKQESMADLLARFMVAPGQTVSG